MQNNSLDRTESEYVQNSVLCMRVCLRASAYNFVYVFLWIWMGLNWSMYCAFGCLRPMTPSIAQLQPTSGTFLGIYPIPRFVINNSTNPTFRSQRVKKWGHFSHRIRIYRLASLYQSCCSVNAAMIILVAFNWCFFAVKW